MRQKRLSDQLQVSNGSGPQRTGPLVGSRHSVPKVFSAYILERTGIRSNFVTGGQTRANRTVEDGPSVDSSSIPAKRHLQSVSVALLLASFLPARHDDHRCSPIK